ncbi:MAG: helix-turn-helix transcriptional regulator [Desulfurococcaceae archaeon]|uniref:Transcriptional regulator n=1 Tax=Staphylothermus marinus TaxID=2280 RepID=A0A7C4D7C4_STAMA
MSDVKVDPRRIIVEILEKYGELNITRISKLSGYSFRSVAKYLSELVEQGFVEERRYGRLRLFRLRKTQT